MNYTVIHEPSSPVILHAPHGSWNVPAIDRDTLFLSDEELQQELLCMQDTYTDGITESLALKTGFNAFINRLSRLVFDPERFPDEREEMNAVGMGFVYTHGSHRQLIRKSDESLKNRVLSDYFQPYAQSLENLTTKVLERHGKAIILDIHSYASKALPYELHQEDRRPEICIGTDSFHTPDALGGSVYGVLSEAGYETFENNPFKGTYVPLKYYGVDNRVKSLMLEIRRDMYMDEKTGRTIPEKYRRLTRVLHSVAAIASQF